MSNRSKIYFLSDANNDFENLYLEIRGTEDRLYQDEEVKMLPYLPRNHKHAVEWRLRADSFRRAFNVLEGLHRPLHILDLGCGCGWFTAKLATTLQTSKIVGADINRLELLQAQRLFKFDNCRFVYWDISQDDWNQERFDIVTLNSSIQYFESLSRLFKRLFNFMKPEGTILIWDSPIYKETEKEKARNRSKKYFEARQTPEMINHYHHHTWDELANFDYSILYDPNKLGNRIFRRLNSTRSPFHFVSVSKNLIS